MLKEREEKKKAKEAAKAECKEECAQKKLLKEAEKTKKQVGREDKRRLKEVQKLAKSRSKKKRKPESSDESEGVYNSSALVSDDDSSNFDEEFETCPSSNKRDQHLSRWIKCVDRCTRWHFMCANRSEYELLDHEERKKLPSVCPLCE